MKSLYRAANKLRGTFAQCSTAVKTLYFVTAACANVCLPIVEKIHADYGMKRLRIAFNTVYRIMH